MVVCILWFCHCLQHCTRCLIAHALAASPACTLVTAMCSPRTAQAMAKKKAAVEQEEPVGEGRPTRNAAKRRESPPRPQRGGKRARPKAAEEDRCVQAAGASLD